MNAVSYVEEYCFLMRLRAFSHIVKALYYTQKSAIFHDFNRRKPNNLNNMLELFGGGSE